MKGFHFNKQICLQCKKEYDMVKTQCPYCGALNQNEKVARSWKECTPLGTGREILSLLIGYFGLNIIVTFVQIAILIQIKSGILSSGLVYGELKNVVFSIYDLSSGKGLAVIFFSSYVFLFIGMVFLLKGNIKPIINRFKKPMTYYGAFFALVLIFLFNFIYGNLTYGLTSGQSNQNQSNIVSIVAIFPFTSTIVFGILGPFCEECTYRLGLFNLLKRVNTVAAYFLSALFFASIHFNWGNATSALEWINIPPYIFSGFVFALIYDKFGFGASYLAHAANNIISVLAAIH